MMVFLGIDPGISGAFVAIQNSKLIAHRAMPLTTAKDVDFHEVIRIIKSMDPAHIFLERAVSFGMGSKGAFNYGRGFAALEIAVSLTGIPVTYVEPGKWAKEMHEGIDANIKAKAKSIIAFERLFAANNPDMPKSKNGKIHEGVLDAFLIAAYGARKLGM